MKQNKETLKQFFETGDKPTQQQYADLIDSYVDAKQPEGEANRRFVIDETGEVSVASEQQVPEYTLSPISGTNTVDLLKDGVSVSQIDLTPYLDNANLARLVSGTVDTNGLATFTRDDNSTFTVDFGGLNLGGINPTDANLDSSFDKSLVYKTTGEIGYRDTAVIATNFAYVKSGSISHTPKLGSFENYYNDIESVLSDITDEMNAVQNGFTKPTVHYEIVILDSATYIIDLPNSLQKDYNVTFSSTEQPTINLLGTFSFIGSGGINMPNGTITCGEDGVFAIEVGFTCNLGTFIGTDEAAVVDVPGNGEFRYGCFTTSAGSLGTGGKIVLNIGELTFRQLSEKRYIIRESSASNNHIRLDIDIKKLNVICLSNSFSFNVWLFRIYQAKEVNARIDVLDLTQVTATSLNVLIFGALTSYSTGGNRFVGIHNYEIGNIVKTTNTQNPPVTICRNAEGVIANVFFNGTTSEVPVVLYDSQFGSYDDYVRNVTATGYLNDISNGNLYFIGGLGFNSLDRTDREGVFVKLKNLKYRNISTTGIYNVAVTKNSSTAGFVPKVIIENCEFHINNKLINIIDNPVNTSLVVNSDTLVEFRGLNKIELSTTQDYFFQAELENYYPSTTQTVVNYGKILHNSINANYTDARAVVSKETVYLHSIS